MKILFLFFSWLFSNHKCLNFTALFFTGLALSSIMMEAIFRHVSLFSKRIYFPRLSICFCWSFSSDPVNMKFVFQTDWCKLGYFSHRVSPEKSEIFYSRLFFQFRRGTWTCFCADSAACIFISSSPATSITCWISSCLHKSTCSNLMEL